MITGDAIKMAVNLTQNLPSGITTNGEEYLTSMELIRKYSDIVIGGHDLTIKPFQTKSFPKVVNINHRYLSISPRRILRQIVSRKLDNKMQQ